MARKRNTDKRGQRKGAGKGAGATPDAAPALERAFAAAVAHYRQGRLVEAERDLLAVQRRRPDVPDVLRLLALIALRDGRAGVAADLLDKAATAAPHSAELFNLLGGALRKAGRLADAIAAYRRAVALAPELAEAHYNLGNALKADGRSDDAIAHYGRAVDLKPDFADACYNLGSLLRRAGRADEAAALLAKATRLNPKDAEAFVALGHALADLGRSEDALAACERAIALRPDLAHAHYIRGNVLRQCGRLDEAVAAYRRALAIDPDMAEAMNNLGEALSKLGQAAEAVTLYRAALERQPRLAGAFSNLGNALAAEGKFEEAIENYRRAIALEPGDAIAHTSLGNALQDMGAFAEGIACHRRAVAIDPGFAAAHHNLGLALLVDGQLEEGWTEFEWRWRMAEVEEKKRAFPQPAWSGEDVAGKTVLVWAEQGVGDEVLYAGMVPDLVERGARVVLECERRLVPLFRRSFTGVACVAERTPPAAETQAAAIDYQMAAGSLGRWLRPDLGSFPGRPSYLVADPAARAALGDKYRAGGDDRLLVGIAWISKNKNVGRQKSMSLAELAPLAAVPGVTLVDLQYGDTAAERRAFEKETGAAIVHDEAVDQMADLDAFAAQVAAMDLVISVSNTTVHMAGALGVPAWVMLHVAPLNCWLLGRETSLWYPSARLFRQTRVGEWRDVVERIGSELRKRARCD